MTERSLLYVPADQPGKLARALERGADGVIVDLEDAVAPSAKDGARTAAAEWLGGQGSGGPTIWVRVNSGERREEDVRALARWPALTGICLAKVDGPDELVEIAGLLDSLGSPARLVPLLESATAVLDARRIAAAPRVSRLQVGEADLSAELGVRMGEDERELLWVRSQIVLVSAAAGLDPPLGPVSTEFRDLDRLRISSAALRRLGYAGRACIHPAQLAIVHEVFTPSVEEVERARDVVRRFEAAASSGVVLDADGRMVDEAVVHQARRTLATARAAQ